MKNEYKDLELLPEIKSYLQQTKGEFNADELSHLDIEKLNKVFILLISKWPGKLIQLLLIISLIMISYYVVLLFDSMMLDKYTIFLLARFYGYIFLVGLLFILKDWIVDRYKKIILFAITKKYRG